MIGILFDLDGTLLNTLDDLADAVNFALTAHGYPTRTIQEVRAFVGNGAANLISRSVPQGADPAPIRETYQAYYKAHSQDKTRPYPGIPEALVAIQEQFPVAIVSNKPDHNVKELAAEFFPGVYALGETPDCPRKPAPDMLYKALGVLGADKLVYVGDSDVDVITATNAGARCASVLWGFRDEAEIRAAGGAYFCSDPAKLPALIAELANME